MVETTLRKSLDNEKAFFRSPDIPRVSYPKNSIECPFEKAAVTGRILLLGETRQRVGGGEETESIRMSPLPTAIQKSRTKNSTIYPIFFSSTQLEEEGQK
jgi:hypothetical protein